MARALSVGLFLLTVALWVGPFVAAFSVHGWDLKAAVMPSQDEISRVKDQVEGLFEGELSEPEIVENTINPDTGEVSATVEVTSPFNIDVKIREISGDVFCKQHDVLLGSVKMDEQELDVPASGTATFTLVGTLTPEGDQHIKSSHGGDLPDISSRNIVFELEFYGLTVRVENMGWG